MAGGKTVASSGDDTREGFLFALSAYFLWGFLPLFMKAIAHVSPFEIVAHRILWSIPVAGLIIAMTRRTADLKRALREPRTLMMAGLTSSVIAINWGIYVWSIANDRALEAALGYYINPLFSIFLAAVLLKEQLDRLQWTAILLAVIAVGILTVGAGGVPLVAIALTVSWGIYAFFKKTLPVGPTQGFFLEVLILSVPAMGVILWFMTHGGGHFGDTTFDTTMLVASGVVTAVPLILYANGAKLLRLSTIAIMQYIAPTMIFLTAVFIFKEPFDLVRTVAFGFIWTALALYSMSILKGRRARLRAEALAQKEMA